MLIFEYLKQFEKAKQQDLEQRNHTSYNIFVKSQNMETTIVKIGNSKGLIIPKRLLDSLGEGKTVNINVKDGGLLITPVN